MPLPSYDRTQTYAWNYDHAPPPVDADVPPVPGEWTFCGRAIGSPLGIAAGPLLNGRWLLYYASLGFDVLTYKTVRSNERACYDLPNLQPVHAGSLDGTESRLPAADEMQGSWAVSFGMPSRDPQVWRTDLQATRSRLAPEKLLSVSVVGTIQEGWSLDDLAADYARCARWAVDAGADCIEMNFSCPNVATRDGQLFQEPKSAAIVAERVRQTVGDRPLIVKLGSVERVEEAEALVEALAQHVNALSMTNSIATTVVDSQGKLLFDGARRGICGDAIREASLRQTRLFADTIARRGDRLEIVGVGGASRVEHVREYLAAGASAVHLATGAMIDPGAALAIRRAWSATR